MSIVVGNSMNLSINLSRAFVDMDVRHPEFVEKFKVYTCVHISV